MPKDPQPKQRGSVALLRKPDRHGIFVFRITAKKKVALYTAVEIPCEIGGRGFLVHTLGMGPVYAVRIGTPVDQSCECLGYLRHQYCRHQSGLQALADHGLL